MVDIGIVGLDTSHAESFAEVLNDHPTANLQAVWDSGGVRDEAYARSFCARHDAIRYDDPPEMADDVDAAMVLAVDWNAHRDLAVPLLENGVATLIDKPIAGRLVDVRAIREAASDTPLFGGSAVPYHSAVQSFVDESPDGPLYFVGYDDPFYYGCHLVDAVVQIVDADWATVSPADDPGRTVDVVFEDGTFVTLRLDSPKEDRQFAFLGIGNRTTVAEVGSEPADMRDMYESYIDTFLEAVADGRSHADRVLDGGELLIAIDAAIEHGRTITPNCETLEEHAVDSRPFVADYAPYY